MRLPAAHMAACDAIPLLITFLFAAESRVRPYNEYIEWELGIHPLKNLPIEPAVFTKKISAVLSGDDTAQQHEFLALAQKIAGQSKIGQVVLKSWEGYYFG